MTNTSPTHQPQPPGQQGEMKEKTDVVIWWLNQECCEAIGETLPKSIPAYVRREYVSRWGRPGRGRLWVADELDPVAVSPWPDSPMAVWLGEDFGGIAVWRRDYEKLNHLPGVFTDLKLMHLGSQS